MTPYGLISDTHHHNWTAFAVVNPDGVNSRLQQILDETLRCAETVKAAGGDTIVHAGDLFHVRGSVAPSVLNPTLATYKKIINSGIRVVILAGNHDLEGRETNDIGSAITALREVGCKVVNHRAFYPLVGMAFLPYTPKVADLKELLETTRGVSDGMDLIIHAGIDGVIPGLPDHGLSAEYLSKLGFRRVFAGHYHHHKQLEDNVWSIGALTHQTWSDVGSKAGFLVVGEEVKWYASHAPSFIAIDGSTDPDDIPLLVDGNYVRAKISSSKPSDIEALRSYLTEQGAKGVTIISQPAKGVTRVGSTIKAGASMNESVADFINSSEFERKPDLSRLCGEILKEVQEEA